MFFNDILFFILRHKYKMSELVVFDTTRLALEILVAAVKKTLDNKVLTEDESKAVGKAMGWLALMTVNTENDVFANYIVELKELDAVIKKNRNTSMMSNRMKNRRPMGSLVYAYGGAYRKRKMRGGRRSWIFALIMGVLSILWAGNAAYNLHRLDEQRDIVRRNAVEQINSACPANLAVAPAKPIFAGFLKAEYQARLTQYEQDVIGCESVRQRTAVRVRDAETRLNAALDAIPRDIGVITTAAVLAAQGPLAPASIAVAGTIGSSVATVARQVMSGSFPENQEQMIAFTTAIAEGFPALPTAAPRPPGGAAAPGGGKRRGTRRSRKSHKMTRRR